MQKLSGTMKKLWILQLIQNLLCIVALKVVHKTTDYCIFLAKTIKNP